MEIIPPQHKEPDSLSLVVGTSSDGISDIQTMNDGNEYHIDEVTGAPGTDLRITFNNVLRFANVVYNAYYESVSSTHTVLMEIYNYETQAWDAYTTIQPGLGYNYRYFDVPDYAAYIQDATVQIKFVHELAGSATHDFYIDYIALVR